MMKTITICVTVLFLVLIQIQLKDVRANNSTTENSLVNTTSKDATPLIDSRVIECLPDNVPKTDSTFKEYANLLVITDLLRIPLKEIAKRDLMLAYNLHMSFLHCAFRHLGYLSIDGEFIFDVIERSLREAIILEVGTSGPSLELCTLEAKKMVTKCRYVSGLSLGHNAMLVQNCLLVQIKRFEKIMNEVNDLESPDLTYISCVPGRVWTPNILEFNQVEMVNNLKYYNISYLLKHRGSIRPENTALEEYIACVWQNENYVNDTYSIQYDVLQKELQMAFENTLGTSGPTINLSRTEAKKIINFCRDPPAGRVLGRKIYKVQNCFIQQLRPFSIIDD